MEADPHLGLAIDVEEAGHKGVVAGGGHRLTGGVDHLHIDLVPIKTADAVALVIDEFKLCPACVVCVELQIVDVDE